MPARVLHTPRDVAPNCSWTGTGCRPRNALWFAAAFADEKQAFAGSIGEISAGGERG